MALAEPLVTEETTTVVDTKTGDHDRMSHIVLHGDYDDPDQYVRYQPTPLEAMVNGVPIRALCGKMWVPEYGTGKFPVCPTCVEIAESNGWGDRIPNG